MPSARPHERALSPARLRRLTPRQRQILELAATGVSVPDIAAQLGISVGTVYERLFFIRSRLNAPTNGHAAALAAAQGEIDVDDAHAREVFAPVFEGLDEFRGSRGQRFFGSPESRADLAQTLLPGPE